MLYRAGLATVAAGAALALAPLSAQAADCGTIELGAAVSATGIYAANGQNPKNGSEFAVKKINDAGGVTIGGKCYHFAIKYYDDESTPVRADAVEAKLHGASITEAAAAQAGAEVAATYKCYGDIRASADYRKHLISELTCRALLTAAARAGVRT